jgi:glycerate-2-kinase
MSIFLNYEELISGEDKRRGHVLDILEAGIESVPPKKAMKDFFNSGEAAFPSKVFVCGWGKASVEMANSFGQLYSKRGEILGGHIIALPSTNNTLELPEMEISFGAHPVPDTSSVESGEQLLSIARELKEEDTLVCLISGGGSAMFEVPKNGIELEELQQTYTLLIESGADIHDVNSVRRALSQSKGGGLAKAAYPANVINIVISDVPGNNLEDVASGATVIDPFKIKSIDVVKKYKIENHLDAKILEAIRGYKPIDKTYFQKVETHIIADNNKAVEAMVQKAVALGYEAVRYPGYLQGEARTAVNFFMETEGNLIIGGGETTVTITGDGRGGRNQEFVLAGLKKLKGGILASIGTDGIDGNTDAAGAIGDEKILEKAREKGYEVDPILENNNSYEFLKECGGLLITGNTGTNVADICVYLKEGGK